MQPLVAGSARALESKAPLFQKEKHISYWLRCFRSPLPTQYMSMDSNRIALAFFTVAALDLLDILHTKVTSEERAASIEWIYQCQNPQGGFRGNPGTDFGAQRTESNSVWDPATIPATYFALGALAILGNDFAGVHKEACLRWLASMQRSDGSFGETLGEKGTIEGGRDARFGYCAMAVRWMLRGHSPGSKANVTDVNVDQFVDCCMSAENYDGGVADTTFHESHAGFTYCTIGACSFMELLPDSSSKSRRGTQDGLRSRDATIRWLVHRLTTAVDECDSDSPSCKEDDDDGQRPFSVTAQTPRFSGGASDNPLVDPRSAQRSLQQNIKPSNLRFDNPDPPWVGFNGRSNKLADTCYVWWAGGSLRMLDALNLVDAAPIKRYLIEKTQHLIAGGFGKSPGSPPDIYHAYLGLAALSVLDESERSQDDSRSSSRGDDESASAPVLCTVDAALCFSARARDWIASHH